jgi:hypothetical protein
MKDVMGSSFSFLLTTSLISLNAPEFVQIAPALQTAFIVSVSSIIIIIYSIVWSGWMMVTFIGLKRQILVKHTGGDSSCSASHCWGFGGWATKARCREQKYLAAVFPGMFNGCIGVADAKEYPVLKYLDPFKERKIWSGKKD